MTPLTRRVLRWLVHLVDFCRRHARPITVLAALAMVGLSAYAVLNFKIDTDPEKLVNAKLEWRQRELRFDSLFPQRVDLLVIVVDGKTPDISDRAAATLTDAMVQRPDLFRTIYRPDASEFFRKNGLLFLSVDELRAMSDQLITAQPFIGALISDPSVAGLFSTLDLFLTGVEQGEAKFSELNRPFDAIAATIETVLAGKPEPMNWQTLFTGRPPAAEELRRFILTQPVLDFTDLESGSDATSYIRDSIRNLGLTPNRGINVRLTGPVALADEEFGSVSKGSGLATLLSLSLATLMLFLALKVARIVFAMVVTLFVGLVATMAFAMATIGSLNMVSVAFAVMFVGVAADFSIQLGVRYRDERHRVGSFRVAMRRTAAHMGIALMVAAAATSAGFLSFVPANYPGVSELGLIAGVGMLIGVALNLTLLPALLGLLRPPGEKAPIGFRWMRGLDHLLLRRRHWVAGIAGLLFVAALATLPRLSFDFNPLHLKDPTTESVQTLFDLMENPNTTPYTIDVVTPSRADAAKLAEQVEKLPEVAQAVSINSFVPDDQDPKLAIIQDLLDVLGPTLDLPRKTLIRDGATVRGILQSVAQKIARLAPVGPDGASGRRLAEALAGVIARDERTLGALDGSLMAGLQAQFDQLRLALSAQKVGYQDLPFDLVRQWVAPGGEARIEVFPKGDARDNAVLQRFVASVRTVAPALSGAPVSIQESANTVVDAFVTAGVTAVIVIALLLYAVLRRVHDVGRVLAPLVLAGALTLATSVVLGLPLNFANIIALPLLLGIGVTFAIYFVMNWRTGQVRPLQSSTARAILFSALTTGTAFGSLALSSHPGTRDMGVLLTIALVWTILATLFFLPALLRPLRKARTAETAAAPPPLARS